MAVFNERLSEALRLRGWSQQRMAEAIGVGRAIVNQYCGGRCQPNNIERVIEMAKLLNVSAPWLAGYDTPMEEHDLISCFKFKERLKEALSKSILVYFSAFNFSYSIIITLFSFAPLFECFFN